MKYAGCAALGLSGAFCFAADPPLESLLVTAHAPGDARAATIEPVAVIGAEDIALINPADSMQLMRQVPGLYASREGGPGGVNSLSIRGAEPNFTVVLIDGVPVNDPTNTRGGSFDMATLAAGEAKRVSVIRGPQTLIYGSDALAGVVRVDTAVSAPQVSVRHELSEFSARRSDASLALGDDRQSFSLAGGREDAGNVYTGSDLELDHYRAAYNLRWEDRLRLTAGLRRTDYTKRAYPEQSGGPMFAANDARDRSEGDDRTAYLNMDLAVTEDWRLNLHYADFDHILDFRSPGIEPFDAVPPNRYEADYARSQWRAVSALQWGPLAINAGIDRRWEDGESTGEVVFTGLSAEALAFLLGLPAPPADSGVTVPFEFPLATDYALRRTSEGEFVQLNYQFDNGAAMSGGIRRDNIDDNEELTRKYALSWPLLDTATLTASYAEGFKSPSFFALGHALVGNPDLRPEQAESYQAGLDWQVAPGWRLRVSGFVSDYTDLIDFDAEQFTSVNRSEVATRGGELVLGWTRGPWQLEASLAHVDIDVKDSDRNLANRPANLAALTANWQVLDTLSWYARYHWTDEQFATSLHTGETRQFVLDDYALLDTSLRWEVADYLALTLSIDNILNENYQEAVGFPGAPRVGRLTVELQY